jgi:dipeptidyl aminopeptidase/acylaminoacyl peptidase
MSATRDPDPIVRAWLDLMPDEAPDRVLDAIRDAIELTPQAAAGRLGRRRLPSLARYLAVAAAAIVVAVGAMAFFRWLPDTAVGPSPLPSATIGPSAIPTSRVIPVVPGDRWLLYVNPPPDPGLSLVRPDGSDDHRIAVDVQGEISDPTWSHDGEQIAFASGAGPVAASSIWTATADGTGVRRLVEAGGACPNGVAGPDWSPDGRRISFICRSGVTSSIRILDVASGSTSDLTSVTAPDSLQSPPRWSPDGQTIAFDIATADPSGGGRPAGLSIALVPVGGGEIRRLAPADSFTRYPDWSPAGDRISFTYTDLPNALAPTFGGIGTVRPDGGGLQPLTRADNRVGTGEGRWSPDGSGLIAVAAIHATPLHLARVDSASGDVTVLDVTGVTPAPRPMP